MVHGELEYRFYTELRGASERVLGVGLVRRLLQRGARPLGLEDDRAAGGQAQHAHRRPVRGGLAQMLPKCTGLG